MRILHVIASIDPKLGGTTEALRIILRHGPAGLASEVLTLDPPDALYLDHIGAPVHALGPVRSIYSYSSRTVPWLRANRSRFDGVVVHGLWQHCGLAVWHTLGGRVPYMVFPHGMLDPYFKHEFPAKHLKKSLYWLLAEYWVLRGAHRTLFTCEAEAELARQSFRLHRWKPTVVPFGTIPPEGDAAAQREAFFTRFPGLRGRRLLLFLGRIDPKKGCDLLIDAFIRVASREPRLDLVMAGPDAHGWHAELEARAGAQEAAARIHWPGMLSGDVKWGAFYAAEAFVLPSHQENFGIAVAEALACGTPVLVSDKVNIAPEVTRDGAGLMEPDTAEGTGRLLTRWLAMSASEREQMSARALDCFHRRYDMRENAKAVAELFAAELSLKEHR